MSPRGDWPLLQKDYHSTPSWPSTSPGATAERPGSPEAYRWREPLAPVTILQGPPRAGFGLVNLTTVEYIRAMKKLFSMLAARGETPAAFAERCIPPGGVVHRSFTSNKLALHALPSGRLARLGATRAFHHGLLGVLAVLATASISGQNDGAVAAAAAALGAESLRSIQYSGWGSDYTFGQAYDGASPWPRFYLPRMTVSI